MTTVTLLILIVVLMVCVGIFDFNFVEKQKPAPPPPEEDIEIIEGNLEAIDKKLKWQNIRREINLFDLKTLLLLQIASLYKKKNLKGDGISLKELKDLASADFDSKKEKLGLREDTTSRELTDIVTNLTSPVFLSLKKKYFE